MRAESQDTQINHDLPERATTRQQSWSRTLLPALLALYFVAGGAFLALRYLVLPQADRWRGEIAAYASASLGLPVSIGTVQADWSGLRPRLHLREVTLSDAQGAPALSLQQVDATLAWASLVRLRPYFHRLEIREPTLQVVRAADGALQVAGIAMSATDDGEDGQVLGWLLDQRQLVVRQASVVWVDAQRGAPPLTLSEVDFRFVRRFGGHRAALAFRPQQGIAERIELRAELDGGAGPSPAQWSGELFARVQAGALDALAPWVDLPGELSGRGDVALWASVAGGRIERLTADLALGSAGVRLAGDLPRLELDAVGGRFGATRAGDRLSFSTRALALRSAEGVEVEPTDIELEVSGEGEARQGRFSANRLDLAALSALAAHLPFDAALRERLAAFAASGRFEDVEWTWRGAPATPSAWSVRADFAGIGVKASETLPGLIGLDGHVEGDHTKGRFRLAGERMALALPHVFAAPLRFDTLAADGGWQRREGRVQIDLDGARFANADLRGDASGSYRLAAQGRGDIDLQAHLDQADGTAVWRYLPLVVNDLTRNWLERGIVAGRAHDARLRLQGPLDHFPFRGGEGTFLITAKVSDATLDYAPDWPGITGIEAGLRFDGPLMRITASRGKISGVALREVVAEVPDLANGNEMMTITGIAEGETGDFLRFVGDSPVSRRISGFTDDMRAEGRGRLDLRLDMPLRHVADTAVDGRYRFADNRLTVVEALPPVERASGTVRFTGATLEIPEATGLLFGAPLRIGAMTEADGAVRFDARGAAQLAAVHAHYGWPLLAHLSGQSPWAAQITVRGGQTRVSVDSSLQGVASSLPAPLNKSAADALATKVRLDFERGAPMGVEARLGERAEFVLSVPRGEGALAGASGGLGIGVPARRAERGLMVAIARPALDIDAWRALLPEGDGEGLPLAGIALETGELTAFGETVHAVELRARREGSTWQAELRAKEAEGTLSWQQDGEGAIRARFARLMLGRAKEVTGRSAPGERLASLPALDVVAERFGLRGLDLGRLEVEAFNRGGRWHMSRLAVGSEDGRLEGRGSWQPGRAQHTDLDFSLTTGDVGRLLARLGYPNAIKGGTATLSGRLGWQGAPTDLDYPSMNGELELLAESGQFRRLEPGVGRLLGVLSLQSLPRRITLDFRDVFSEGFAFDRISGSIEVERGVLRTDPLEIRGPAARVFMRGSASVPDETQDLKVTVQPTLSESVAIGAALSGSAAGVINPVAGVVTYLVQKALQDPVEKLFSFEYAVTGTWDAPKVEKIGAQALAPAEPPKSPAGSP